jgi:hypothetical protein
MSDTTDHDRDGAAGHSAGQSPERDAAGLPVDDERLNRERIEQTGEPERDALGNADGAS